MKVLIITGHLAYPLISEVVSDSKQDIIVHIADNTQVAAFLTPRQIIKEIKTHFSNQLDEIDMILVPGLIKKGTREITKELGIPTFKGSTDGADLAMVLNLIENINLSEDKPADKLIEEEKMTMTPYSPLAAGRVCRMWSDNTKRYETDKIAVSIYENGKENDMPIIQRIKEIADKKNITMAQVSMAWLLSKKYVSSPVIGCTKIKQLEDLISAVKIKLTEDEIKYLEELYKPHKPVGPFTKEQTINLDKFFNSKK